MIEIVTKECLHKFHSVYYGSEWTVECKKCDKDVFSLYSIEDTNKIVNKLINKNKKKLCKKSIWLEVLELIGKTK